MAEYSSLRAEREVPYKTSVPLSQGPFTDWVTQGQGAAYNPTTNQISFPRKWAGKQRSANSVLRHEDTHAFNFNTPNDLGSVESVRLAKRLNTPDKPYYYPPNDAGPNQSHLAQELVANIHADGAMPNGGELRQWPNKAYQELPDEGKLMYEKAMHGWQTDQGYLNDLGTYGPGVTGFKQRMKHLGKAALNSLDPRLIMDLITE